MLRRFLVIVLALIAFSSAALAAPVVAVFELDGPITEAPSQELALFSPAPSSLRELVKRMNEAAGDENVKAVVMLSSGGVQAGLGQIEEIRQSMQTIKDKGKEVFVHSDSLRLGDYLLFSAASRISVVPTADLWIHGIRAEQPYLRGLLDKIGVQPDFLHVGDYKSAGELFMRDGPSKEADEMTNWLLDGLYGTMVDLVAEGRKVSADQARKWFDAGPYQADEAKKVGLIDAIEHRQDFDAMLKKKFGDDLTYDRRYGTDKREQLDFSSPFAMFKIWGDLLTGGSHKEPSTKPAVGIVYVDGMIMPGKQNGLPLLGAMATSSDIREALDEAARDEQVKAVVLRVDSPGGSAVASEIILDATRRVKAKKPLIVSMGNIAGSGGYYVSCAADTVFADRSTITASIGCVAGKLVTTDMWKKVGITFKSYDRGANAGLMSSSTPFNEGERKRIQKWMDDVYVVFKGHVTEARRDKLKKPLDEIAGGRVYTGQQALELGLVDKIGTLSDAVRFAAAEAKVQDYDVRVVPKTKNLLERLMEEAGGGGEDNQWLATPSLTKLALPYLNGLDPQRVAAIRTALARLQLLGRECIVMMTPEVYVFH